TMKMRHTSTLVGLTLLVSLAATSTAARAQGPAPVATEAAAPAAADKRIELGITLLPMSLGTFSAPIGGIGMKSDAAFAYGAGLQAGYIVVPGLTVGLAPQAFFNVKPKEQPSAGARQIDVLARVAYTLHLVDTIAVYAEVLPGYSLIQPP